MQIAFGDDETIVGFAHGRQPLPRHLRQRRLIQQHAARRGAAAPHPPAQLVQLGETQAFGVLDDHQRCVGHVDADFDHRRRHQQLHLAGLERGHRLLFLAGLQPSVHQRDPQFRKLLRQRFERALRGLGDDFIAVVDQGADPIRLPAFGAGAADAFDQFRTTLGAQHDGLHRRAPRRQFVDR